MPNYVELDYQQAHDFVSKNSNLGFYWDGWDIIKWTPNANGYAQKNGMFRNNQWGFFVRVPFTERGTWKVLEKYV